MNVSFERKGKFALKIVMLVFVLLVTFFPAKYNNNIYGYLPGLALLILLLLSAWHLIIIRRHLWFETENLDVVCQRGQSVDTVLRIVNGSFLLCPKVRAQLSTSDFFREEDLTSQLTFAIQGKREAEFPLNIKTEHIGVYNVGVKLLQVYDLTGIFNIAIPGNKTFRITVLPKTSLMEEIRLDERQLTESRSIPKSSANDGFDYTGVREYALGDSMKRIHWKLSAHSSGYMTKITEGNKKSDLAVVIDFALASLEHKSRANIYDCLIETALSLAEQALNKDVEYSLLFIGRDGEINRAIPKGETDYENLVPLFPSLNVTSNLELLDGAGILEKEKHLGNKSSNIMLCTSRITEPLIRELIAVKHQQRNPELYYIVPFELNRKEVEEAEAVLKVLDDYDIQYHRISAEPGL